MVDGVVGSREKVAEVEDKGSRFGFNARRADKGTDTRKTKKAWLSTQDKTGREWQGLISRVKGGMGRGKKKKKGRLGSAHGGSQELEEQ